MDGHPPSADVTDPVDVKALLQDVLLLKAEVTYIRAKLKDSERIVLELSTELATLRKQNATTSEMPQSAPYVCVRRGTKNCETSPVSNNASSAKTDAQVKVRPAPITSAPAAPTTSSVPTPRVCKKKSYAQVSCPQTLQQQAPCSTQSTKKVDGDGFTLVEKKRRPRLTRNLRGTATASAAETTLRVVEPTVSLYISRFDPNTTGEEVLRYVKERACFWTKDTIRLNLRRLESTRDTTFKSYVLQVPAKYKDMFLTPDFWPAGVAFRRFREARPIRTP